MCELLDDEKVMFIAMPTLTSVTDGQTECRACLQCVA